MFSSSQNINIIVLSWRCCSPVGVVGLPPRGHPKTPKIRGRTGHKLDRPGAGFRPVPGGFDPRNGGFRGTSNGSRPFIGRKTGVHGKTDQGSLRAPLGLRRATPVTLRALLVAGPTPESSIGGNPQAVASRLTRPSIGSS